MRRPHVLQQREQLELGLDRLVALVVPLVAHGQPGAGQDGLAVLGQVEIVRAVTGGIDDHRHRQLLVGLVQKERVQAHVHLLQRPLVVEDLVVAVFRRALELADVVVVEHVRLLLPGALVDHAQPRGQDGVLLVGVQGVRVLVQGAVVGEGKGGEDGCGRLGGFRGKLDEQVVQAAVDLGVLLEHLGEFAGQVRDETAVADGTERTQRLLDGEALPQGGGLVDGLGPRPPGKEFAELAGETGRHRGAAPPGGGELARRPADLRRAVEDTQRLAGAGGSAGGLLLGFARHAGAAAGEVLDPGGRGGGEDVGVREVEDVGRRLDAAVQEQDGAVDQVAAELESQDAGRPGGLVVDLDDLEAHQALHEFGELGADLGDGEVGQTLFHFLTVLGGHWAGGKKKRAPGEKSLEPQIIPESILGKKPVNST